MPNDMSVCAFTAEAFNDMCRVLNFDLLEQQVDKGYTRIHDQLDPYLLLRLSVFGAVRHMDTNSPRMSDWVLNLKQYVEFLDWFSQCCATALKKNERPCMVIRRHITRSV